MINQQWSAIHDVFSRVRHYCENLCPEPLADENTVGWSDPGNDRSAAVLRVREEIRAQLDYLRVSLSSTLTERECYLLLFPIVIHFDEKVRSQCLSQVQNWSLLQKELYQIDDGGELFFDTLDDLLHKPDTLPLIYEVYYLCLRDGFQGRHNGDAISLRQYMEKLEGKISVAASPETPLIAEAAPIIKSYPSSGWYYGAVGLILLAGYFLLSWMSGYYVQSY